jgi:UDP-N-acetylglucosamine 1-carboxyvinyltransferase
MFLAPLLARLKKATVPLPGGDQIGNRPLNRHFDSLRALGAKIEVKDDRVEAECKQLIGGHYHFPKNSHTGTETMIMAAVLAYGKTIIDNAALEPEVDDLIDLLNAMGAKINRQANRRIEIEGVRKLSSVIHKVMPDRNEAVSYAVAALTTQGDIVVENARQEHLTAFLEKLSQAGGGFEVSAYGIRFFYKQPLKATNINTSPHPGFMTDWQPLWAILATQSKGESEIVETVFTNRFQYAKDLQAMGAKIIFFQPKPKKPEDFYNFNLADDQPEFKHGMKIIGQTQLIGKECVINDIRAGATLALAGLTAKGTTSLTGLEHIDRGYEDFAGRLLTLGANIKTINN